MIRNTCFALAASGLALAATGCAGRAAESAQISARKPVFKAAASKPNIIFVLADDMGYRDLGCYGGRGVQSRHIDRLASEGIRFTQFYVNSPICSPSRTAFTTGQYPARWNITSFINNRAANERRGMAQWLDVKAPSLARELGKAGYATGHFGKWHMGGGRDVGEAPLPTDYGFDESLTQFEGLGDRVLPYLEGEDGQPQRMGLGVASEKLGRGKVRWEARPKVTGAFVERALEFVRKAERAGKPFYLNLWPDDVHSPFEPPKALRGDGSKRALYRGVLSNMDAQLGPLFDAIRNNPKLRDNTIIIFASDNGPEGGAGSAGVFRGSKGAIYEGGIREPFIVWAPKFIAPKQRGTVNTKAVFSAVDVLPSLLHLAGTQRLDFKSDGENLSETLLGKKANGRTQPLFWKRPPERDGTPNEPLPDLAVREGDWKLLVAEDGTEAQLYHLASDESEAKNVASLHPQTVQRLTKSVLAWNRTLPVLKPSAPKTAVQNKTRRFVLRKGEHLDAETAPQIAATGFRLQVTFDTQAPADANAAGVIVAQGGVANGYSLFVDEAGQLVFLVRQNKQAYTVKSAVLQRGPHTARAALGPDGTITLAVDEQTPVQGRTRGLFAQQPLDGLDVGADEGGLAGDYRTANPFSGTIQEVVVELTDAD